MKRNNIWNRIFHNKEVALNKERFLKNQKLVELSDSFIKALDKARDLNILMNIHKDAYASGFTENLGPCEYGMFRCKSISEMNSHQVYLGGIYGLNTHDIAFWEQHRDKPYGANGFGIDENYSLYKIIFNQYQIHLRANINSMTKKAQKELEEFKLLGYQVFTFDFFLNTPVRENRLIFLFFILSTDIFKYLT